MKTYLANAVLGDMYITIAFESPSWDAAEAHCLENDLDFLGQKDDSEEVEAMIERTIMGHTEH